jgi:hypothetical protein
MSAEHTCHPSDCVRPAQPQDMIDGFFRVSWGSEGGTILVASTKIVEKIMVRSPEISRRHSSVIR